MYTPIIACRHTYGINVYTYNVHTYKATIETTFESVHTSFASTHIGQSLTHTHIMHTHIKPILRLLLRVCTPLSIAPPQGNCQRRAPDANKKKSPNSEPNIYAVGAKLSHRTLY